MECARRSDEARHLRAACRAPAGGRGARWPSTGQPPRRLAAPEGAEGCAAGGRPARGEPSHLSARPRGGGVASRLPRPVLEQGPDGLQGGRRETGRGGLMRAPAAETYVRTQIADEAPRERAFSACTE